MLKEQLIYLGVKSNPNDTSLPDMDTRMVYYGDSLGNAQVKNGFGDAEIVQGEDIEKGRFENGLRIGQWTGTFFAGKNRYEEWYQNGEVTKGVSTDSTGKTYAYTAEKVEPAYPGGIMELVKFVAQHYRYPREAIRQQVKGQVLVSFVVDSDGEMVDFKIVRDLGYGTGDEAVATIKKAKKWKPGYLRGFPVRVAYTIPVRLNP